MNLLNDKSIKCCAFKYSRDNWRLRYLLNPQKTEWEIEDACSKFGQYLCDHSCNGRWMSERILFLKKRIGIIPMDKNTRTLKTMLDEIRNMSIGEYDALYNSLSEKDK